MKKLNFSNSFTVEAWVKPASFSDYQNIFYPHTYGIIIDSNGLWQAQINPIAGQHGNVDPGNGNVYGGTLTTNAWSHLAVTYDGTNIVTWQDGRLISSVAETIDPTGFTTLEFGRSPDNGGERYFAGVIDEIRFSSTVRYTTTFTPADNFTVDPSTVGYWKFNEGAGTIARDASANHFDGTLEGTPLPT